jgi:mRNA interferase RelE/StbE
VNEPPYRLEFADGVRKQLARLPGHIYPRVERIITALPADPRPKFAERLRGKGERYKIALGPYRIVYRIRDDLMLLLVVKVGKKHGSEFYADINDLE